MPPLSPDAPEVPVVSVLVVTWNGHALLERCLPSVLATDHPAFEVVVADNGSTDDTVAWLRATHPDVRTVEHGENLLFAEGNNRALPHCRGQYVCLLNNDVEVEPDWLRPLVDALDDDDRVAAVQPKLLQHGRRDRFEYAGASGGHLDAFGYPFARGRLFDVLEEDRGQYDDAADVFWATGACCLLRRSALEEVAGPGGVLDRRLGMHMEEIDLCWRLWRAGYRVRAVPESRAYHIGGASLAMGSPRKAYLNFRNSLLMLYKNLPPRVWATTFPRRAALDGLAMARALASGDRAAAGAIGRAYADAHRMKALFAAERPASGERVVRPSYRRSIALDHFVRGAQTFDELSRTAFRAFPEAET
jgi:GT2 family glycosyltransferase